MFAIKTHVVIPSSTAYQPLNQCIYQSSLIHLLKLNCLEMCTNRDLRGDLT